MDISTSNNKEIIKELPHKKPIVMVDELVLLDDNKIITKLIPKENNIFVQDGIFSEYGVIEHIAQSAGLRSTLFAARNNLPSPLGYLAAINKFKLYNLAKVGVEIKTKIINIVNTKTIIKIKSISFSNNIKICESEMLFYLIK
jgi:predicted hotdog family 3-hydroxylacyl-ACP dehydratase